ncbi:hypothetical protein KBD13_00935 [Patescibacteria group bacterium]|nr:hypothetical protein [Patescibacteria group bacterium]MDQ5919868.1 hypothetical protein [Patescibacteria group bacterium]
MKAVLSWLLLAILSFPVAIFAQPAPVSGSCVLRPAGRERAQCYAQQAQAAAVAEQSSEAIRLYLLAFEQVPNCALAANAARLTRVQAALQGDRALMTQARERFSRAVSTECTPALPEPEQRAIQVLIGQVDAWLSAHPAPPPSTPAVLRVSRADYDAYVRNTPLGRELERDERVFRLEAHEVILPESARARVEAQIREGRARMVRPPVAPRRRRPVPRLAYALWGASAPLLGWGVYSLWAMGDATAQGQASGDLDRAERARNAAALSAGVSLTLGIVSAAVGTVLYLRRPTQVVVAPVLSSSAAGLAVGGIF